MKKVLIGLLAVLFILSAFAGCGKAGNTSNTPVPTSVDQIKTWNDIIALGNENRQFATYDNLLVYAFKLGDKYYRTTASLDEKSFEALTALDYNDEKYEEKLGKILSPLKVGEIEDLEEQKLTREQMDALVGKTGKDLFEAGWCGSGYNLETMEFWMDYGPFEYTVVFDGKVAEEDYEDFDGEEDVKDLVVKSVEYSSIGDATNIDIEE